MPRIAMIGAGSMVFSRNVISDVLAQPALKEATFSLMDVDAARLELVGQMARSINRSRKANATFVVTPDRRKAIEGAEYVINTIGVGGFAATKTDLYVPESFGVRQVIGDTLCMGGIFRTVRSLPIVLEMVRDIEQLAPKAVLLTYTNPMAAHVLGVTRASKVRAVGLCHGVRYTRGRMIMLARLAEMGPERAHAVLTDHTPHEPGGTAFSRYFHQCVLDETVQAMCAGINHMSAFLVFRDQDGRDLYPLLHEACRNPELRKIEEVRLELFQRFGYFMTETSGHISEYLPWFLRHDDEIQRLRLRPNAYILTCNDLDKTLEHYKELVRTGQPFIREDEPVSIEYASRIINAIETNTPYVFNGNVHNNGGSLISNLPGDSCVEVPAVADALGIHPTSVGELPPQIAAMIRTNINVQDLTVRAIMERRKDYLYQAAYLDPNTMATLSLPKIKELVDAMVAAHGELIPAYLR